MTSAFPAILLPVLSLAGLSWLLSRKCRLSPYVTPLCAAGGIVTCLYISDFFSLMGATGMLLLAAGLLAFAFNLLDVIKSKRPIGKSRAILLAALIGGIAYLYVLNRNAAFTNWDEFSHWGTIIKLIDSENSFHLKEKLIRYYFEDYPPGTALFSYFFLLGTGYSEPVIYFSYSLILVAGCLPAIGLATQVSYGRGLLTSVACFLLFIVLGQGWSSALIDQVVGVLFGGTICAYWLLRNARPYQPLFLIPALCFLVLSKQSGYSFFLVIAGLIAVDRLWTLREQRSLLSKAGSLAMVLPLTIVPFLINKSWYWHVAREGMTSTFSSASLKALFLQFAQCCHTDRELFTVSRFVQVLTGSEGPFPATAGNLFHIIGEQFFRADVVSSLLRPHGYSHGSIVLFFCGLLLVATIFHAGPKRARQMIFQSTFLAAGFAYAVILLSYYLYVFSEYEGRGIVSHERFLGTYELGLGLFAIAMFFSASAKRVIVKDTVAVGIVVFFFLAHAGVVYFGRGAPTMSPMRAEIRKFLEPYLDSTSKYSKAYIVWESLTIQENGFEFWMMHHELRPRNTNHFCFSLGAPHYKGDIWSCNMDEAKVRDAFAGYDHVIVGRGLASLRAQYPNIFKLASTDRDYDYFKVTKSADGLLALEPLRFDQ